MSPRPLLLAAALATAIPAFSTPQLRDATDMWLNPAESGWGINFFHQGDTLFAALFVYGPDGQPRWYVASSLVGGPEVYSGALYEATGPWFGGPFDPGTVVRRQVGTMRVDLRDTVTTLEYTVDGVGVSKQVQRFGFRRTVLSGGRGWLYQPAAAGAAEIRRDQELIQLRDDGATVEMDTASDSEGNCSYRGTRGQNGHLQTVTGTYTCPGRAGPWSMVLDPTPNGFTGWFTGHGLTTNLARIGAARLLPSETDGNGWRTDLWFPPAESGWGLNVVERGNTLFATLFVYDAQGRTRWYVASDLPRSGTGTGAVFSGPLYVTTGPSFASGGFDPAAVMRRQVGTMTFQVQDEDTATLTYSVDGTSVTKQVKRYAFRKNDLSGSYLGYMSEITGGGREAVTITIDDSGPNFAMQTVSQAGNTGTCTYSGTGTQLGGQRYLAGTYSCSGGFSGTFSMNRAAVSFTGFTAAFQGPRFSAMHLVGVRTN